MKKLGNDGVWMGLKETHTDSSTQKEHGIGNRESIRRIERIERHALEAKKAIKKLINSLPPSSLKKLLGKNQVNPYVQRKN